MAITVSLINMKGGVGKSTLTVNLASYFARLMKKKVLVIDLDPQFNASQYLLGQEKYMNIYKTDKATVWDIFEQNTPSPSGTNPLVAPHDAIINVSTSQPGKLDLIPSRFELAFSLKNPFQKESKLAKVVEKIGNEYDLILIDCAPTESILTTAAYLASDYLLVPVKPEYLSSIGLPLLASSIRNFKNEYETSKLQVAGIVFNNSTKPVPETDLSKIEVKELASSQNWHIFQNEIPFSESFPKGDLQRLRLDQV